MKILLFIICLFSITTVAQAQEKKVVTDTIAVAGVCGMCESRIEEAASISGVKKADWNKLKQELIVVYSVKKTSIDEIANAVQNAGHDTSFGPATAGTYEQIDKCCRYRETEIH